MELNAMLPMAGVFVVVLGLYLFVRSRRLSRKK